MRQRDAAHAAAVIARLIAAVALIWLAARQPLSTGIARWLDRAGAATDRADTGAALGAYRQVAARVGDSPTLYRRLAQLSADTGHDDDARIYLFKLAELEGWSSQQRQDLALVLDGAGDEAQARALSLSLLDAGEADPAALAAAADAALSRQAWDEARRALERLAAAAPDDAAGLFRLGGLIAPLEPEQAQDLLQRALVDPAWAGRAQAVLDALYAFDSLSPTEAYTGVGLALIGANEWALAEHALIQAVAVNSVNATALGYLGFVRDQQARDGLPDLESALGMSPAEPTLYYLLGLHWQQVGDEPAAYDAFVQAQALDPGNPALAAEIGASLQRQGDLASAEAWYQQAIALAPNDSRWRGLLAAFYADSEIELTDDRVQVVVDTVDLLPSDPDAYASLGRVYYRTGAYDDAYDALSTAVQLDPARVRSRYYFGVALEHLGDRDGAADSFRYVVDAAGPDEGFGLLASRGLIRLGYSF
ncbi:tetratricopeptide repeat protein [Aggregatilinea lenta]|uniref:tetratricopeptide repeat protein n=1 Tax=Aggregatilinea lenta TaxID=913108 RepID=UPI0013C2A71F|nr:tetratricopeptide repeat protein [Aggregatilinea lenta]